MMPSIKAVIRQHPVPAYYILTFAISWGGGLVVLGPDGALGITQPSQAQFLFTIFAGIAGPSVAGIVLTGAVDGRTGLHDLRSRLLKWRVGARWYAVALLTGPLVASAALFTLSLTDSAFRPSILVSDHKASLLLIGITVGLAVGFFEELGWTGFAIPRLRLRHGILTTGLIVGFLWEAWHLPLFYGQRGPSSMPTALYLSVLVFSFLPSFRVLMVWLYDRTESLLMVMIMHAGLSATSLVLQPQTTGVEVIAYDLIFATALWVLVAIVAAGNRLQHDGSRKAGRRFGTGHPQQYPEAVRIEETGKLVMRYAIVIENAGSNYSAYVPDLPGCVASGATIAETERAMREAIEFHLEGMRADGTPIPEPSSRVY